MWCVVWSDEVWKAFFSYFKKYIVFLVIVIYIFNSGELYSQAVRLIWNKNPEQDVEYYIIYRSTSPDPVNEISKVNATDTTYVDSEIVENQDYYYRIAAIDSAGNVSEYSDQENVFTGEERVNISGNVKYTRSGIPLANTLLNLSGDKTSAQLSDESGNYQFSALQTHSDYSITASRNDKEDGTCIISYDAALAARIAVNLMSNPPSEQKLAADVDKNNEVQMYDAALIAKYAVGLTPGSNSFVGDWGFIPANRSITNISSERTNEDFNAVIFGDVDGNWTPNGQLPKSNNPQKVYSFLHDLETNQGKQITIPFVAETNQEIYSFDIELSYDFNAIMYVDIRKTESGNNFQVIVNDSKQGTLRIGGYSIEPIKVSGTYLELLFEVVGNSGYASQIELKSYRINAESEQYAIATLVIGGDQNEGIPKEYKLYDNFPNPFNPETMIKYQVPTANYVSLKIYNMIGQQIKQLVCEEKKAGIYQAMWDGKNEMSKAVPSGIYIYQLRATNKFIATKKMLLIK